SARRLDKVVSRTYHRSRDRERDRPGACPRRARRQGERETGRHGLPHQRRRRRRHRHRQGCGSERSAAPLDRAPAGTRGERAVSGRAGDDRTGDRERLLLRFLVQAPLYAGRSRRDREAHGRDREARPAGRAPRDEAVKFFRDQGEKYKAEIIASIPEKDTISLYGQGNWIDLCRGPHVPSTGKLKNFKLMRVAGAYWRGDSKNEMLQRIYGTAWAKKEDQDAYLKMLEEAEKR